MNVRLTDIGVDRARTGASGIFLHLADNAAFIDRVDLSVWGERRKHVGPPIQVLRNIPIGGEGRLYARSLHAVCELGNNPIELRYGRTRPFPSIPTLRLILRSDHTPLTAAQVLIARDSLVRHGFRSHISSLELTSDVHGDSLVDIRRHLLTRNWSVREFKDESGRESLYLRGPTSNWQLRVYQKTAALVRVEFVLRRPFLRSLQIEQPPEVLKIGTLGLWRKILLPCDERRALRRMHGQLIW